MFNDSVWTRSGHSTMSRNLYALTFSGFTAFGILVSMVIAQITPNLQMGWIGGIIVLVLAIAGVFVAYGSDVPIVSLTGFMMVTVPFGALLGPFLNQFVPVSIVEAFLVTTIYVAIMGLVGTVIPDSLERWWGWLFGGLVVSLLGYFIIPIAGFFGIPVQHALGIWDWATIALFAFIIMYDFNRAMRIPYTLDNAIDVALSIYLDWLNVFVRYLARRGKRK